MYHYSNALSQLRWAAMLLLVALLVALFLWLRESKQPYWDFRNNVWAVSHLVLEGKVPLESANVTALSQAIGEPLAPGIWAPTVVVLALPLGVLDWQSAGAIWLILNIIAIGILILLSEQSQPMAGSLVMMAGLVAVFPPTLSVLTLGQVSLLMTVISLLALRALAHDRGALAGGLIALNLIKPQLLVIILPMMVARAIYHRRGLPFLRGFAVAFLGQLLALSLLWPRWFDSYRSALTQNPQWDQPNLFSWLAARLSLELGVLLWAANILIALTSVVLISRRSLSNSVYWALALTPLLAPYAWSWDLVLILPLFIHLICQPSKVRGLLGLGYGLVCAAFVAQRVLLDNTDAQFLWVAPVLLMLLAVGHWLAEGERNSEQKAKLVV